MDEFQAHRALPKMSLGDLTKQAQELQKTARSRSASGQGDLGMISRY